MHHIGLSLFNINKVVDIKLPASGAATTTSGSSRGVLSGSVTYGILILMMGHRCVHQASLTRPLEAARAACSTSKTMEE